MDHKKSRKYRVTREINLNSPTNDFVQMYYRNPLLNSLIVQTVLEFYKFNDPKGKAFPLLRLVCKVWDAECSKILRRKTEIPIQRLLEPYPDGLGWEEYRPDCFSVFEHRYNCPYPTTKDFQNFQFTANCESFKNRNVHRWFSVMGEQVKNLHFICPLTCFHQNEYLANVLNKWCPNLETLHLDGIQCFSSLIYLLNGKSDKFLSNNDRTINCKTLQNLTISVVNDSHRANCRQTTDPIFRWNINACMSKLMVLMADFKEMIDLLPKKDLSIRPEISTLFYQLIESSDPNILSNIIEKSISDFEVDWGILGQILKTAPLQKLVIKKLENGRQTQDFLVFLLIHPFKLKSTLKHLEFNNARLTRFCLKALSQLKCSLLTLRMDKIVWRSSAAKHVYDILKNSAETLTSFEIDLENIIYQTGDPDNMNVIQIPFLPKLKSFTNKSIGLLHVNGLELFGNAPNLETCYIDYLNSDKNRRETCEALEKLCAKLDHPSVKDHPLKELKINVGLENRHINLLSKGLKNLTKVEFQIYDLMGFILAWNKSKEWKNIKNLTLSIEPGNGVRRKFVKNVSNEMIAKYFGEMKSLQFLSLTCHTYFKCLVPICIFTSGVRKLSQLTSLKISNMCMSPDEKEEIEQSLAHIPLVSFSNQMVLKRV